MSCQKAQGFLESEGLAVRETENAGKRRYPRDEALALAKSARTVIVAKGKNVLSFDMRRNPPDDEVLAAHLLGPSGNLRAPTIRHGDTFIVGFSEAAYREEFEI